MAENTQMVKFTRANDSRGEVSAEKFAANYDKYVEKNPGYSVDMYDRDGNYHSIPMQDARKMYQSGYTYFKGQKNPHLDRIKGVTETPKPQPATPAKPAKQPSAPKAEAPAAPSSTEEGTPMTEQERLQMSIGAGNIIGGVDATNRATMRDINSEKKSAGKFDVGGQVGYGEADSTTKATEMYGKAETKVQTEKAVNDAVDNKGDALDKIVSDIEASVRKENAESINAGWYGEAYEQGRQREAAERLTPEKLLERISNEGAVDWESLTSDAIYNKDAEGNVLGLKPAIINGAKRSNMSTEAYISRFITPQIEKRVMDRLSTTADRRFLEQRLPKNFVGYLVSKAMTSTLGQLANPDSVYGRAILAGAVEMTENNENKNFSVSMDSAKTFGGKAKKLAMRLTGETASILADSPLFVMGEGIGGVALKMGGKTVGMMAPRFSWLFESAAEKAGGNVASYLMTNFAKMSARDFGRFAAATAVRGSVAGSANMASFMSTSGLLSEMATNPETSMADMGKAWLTGGLRGGALGVALGVSGVAGQGMKLSTGRTLEKGASRLARMSTSRAARMGATSAALGLEISGMSGFDWAVGKMTGEDISFTESLQRNAYMIAGMKISHFMQHPTELAANIKRAFTKTNKPSPYALTDAEVADLRTHENGAHLLDMIYDMPEKGRMAQVVSINDKNAPAFTKELAGILADETIPHNTRQKISASLFGVVEPSRPIFTNASIDSGTKTVRLMGKGSNGEDKVIEVRSYEDTDELKAIIGNAKTGADKDQLNAKFGSLQTAFALAMQNSKDGKVPEGYEPLAIATIAQPFRQEDGTYKIQDDVYSSLDEVGEALAEGGKYRYIYDNAVNAEGFEPALGIAFTMADEAERYGVTREDIMGALVKDPSQLNESEAKALAALNEGYRNFIANMPNAGDTTGLAKEQGREDADKADIVTGNGDASILEQLKAEYNKARDDYYQANDKALEVINNDATGILEGVQVAALREYEVQKLVEEGLPLEQANILLAAVAARRRYDNALMRHEAFRERTDENINSAVEWWWESVAFRGFTEDNDIDIPGLLSVAPDMRITVEDSKGNRYYLRDGNVYKDGTIRSDSGMVIVTDENGETTFLSVNDVKMVVAENKGDVCAPLIENMRKGAEDITAVEPAEAPKGEQPQQREEQPKTKVGERHKEEYPVTPQEAIPAKSEIKTDDKGNKLYRESGVKAEDAAKDILNDLDNDADATKEAVQGELNKANEALQSAKDRSVVGIPEMKAKKEAIKEAESAAAYWGDVLKALGVEGGEGDKKPDVPDWTEDKAADARARGYRMQNGERVDRQEPVEGVEGGKVEIEFASTEKEAEGEYFLMDIGKLQPSHIGRLRNILHFISEAQPKERTDAVSDVASDRIAQNIKPESITASTTAYTGAPIIQGRGEVIQGNNRAIALRKMYQNNPEQVAKYKEYLREHAAEFGLKAEDIDKIENPVLVRRLKVADEEAIRLGQYTQTDLETGGIVRIEPKSTIEKMSDNDPELRQKRIAETMRRMFDTGDEGMSDKTIGELIAENGPKVLKYLRDIGAINDVQYQSAFDKKGGLTEDARGDLRKLILHNIFIGGPDNLPERFEELPDAAKKALPQAMAGDMRLPEDDRMIKQVQNAIIVAHVAKETGLAKGLKTYEEVFNALKINARQTDAFAETPRLAKFSELELDIAANLLTEKQSAIKAIFAQYQRYILGEQGDMFNPAEKLSRKDATERVFDVKEKGGQNNDGGAETGTIPQGGRGDRPDLGQGKGPAEGADEKRTDGTVGDLSKLTDEQLQKMVADKEAAAKSDDELYNDQEYVDIIDELESRDTELFKRLADSKPTDEQIISVLGGDEMLDAVKDAFEKLKKGEELGQVERGLLKAIALSVGPEEIGDNKDKAEVIRQVSEKYGLTADQSEALTALVEAGDFSYADVQRKLKVGYNKANDIVEQLRQATDTKKEASAQDTSKENLQSSERTKLKTEFDSAAEEAKAALKEFFNPGKSNKSLAMLVPVNPEQVKAFPKVVRAVGKLGYTAIKLGAYDFKTWCERVLDNMGTFFKEQLGWDDKNTNDFLTEMWELKFRLGDEVHTIKEWADVEKKKLSGDSAKYSEREGKKDIFRSAIDKRLRESLVDSEKRIKSINELRKIAEECGLKEMRDTDLQEIVESAIVDLARAFASNKELSPKDRFDTIKHLYEMQPSLNQRDTDRIMLQQYSTPAPMAYLMGRFVDPEGKAKSGLEPSAGNGMLTIGLPKGIMHVNDIDEMRISNLQRQGFKSVTNQDGTQSFGEKIYDVVVTNPPFGTITPKEYEGGYVISGLEQQMAINALNAMKDNGRAAIIVGGRTEYAQNGAIKGTKDKVFFSYLYQNYNVVDVINMDGKALYSRQGTGYDVRMILIDGRRTGEDALKPHFPPTIKDARADIVRDYNELQKRVEDDILRNKNKSADIHDTESGKGNGGDNRTDASSVDGKGVPGVRTKGGSGKSELLAEGRDILPKPVGGGTTDRTEPVEGNGETQRKGDNGVDRKPSSHNGSGNEPTETDRGANGGSERGNNGVSERPDDTQRPAGGNDKPIGGGPRTSVEVRRLGAEKVPYKSQSKNPYTLQSQMPAEQAETVRKSLEELGNVDEFLVKELGYSSVEDLWHGSQSPDKHGGLAADQIDSVALAIHQMNNGNAFIIGDQTGIGKGRQAAALIRYGVKKGGCPVFITVKKGLFSDMYRDLCDIGSPELRPFIWAADDKEHSGDVTDKDGNVVYKRPSDKEQKRVVDYINKHGKLPPEYDYVLTTYDSFSSGTKDYENGEKKDRKFGKGKNPNASSYKNGQMKRDALEALAQNSYVIMDESHNASGEKSARSGYLQYITARAKGTTFLSATFAKRPSNMPIYSLRTAISKAGVKIEELIDAVKRGGATFQEIMSKALTEAGQMIRRERDMTGVTIDWKGIDDEEVIQKQREQYDTVIGLFNEIINFQKQYVDPVVNELNDEAADMMGEVDHTPGTRDMGINNTPFASRTYNIVQQVLLSLKAEEAAKRAIEHIKQGKKAVIAVANTNEGASGDVAAMGEDMAMPDLSVNLKKGLEGVLRITNKNALGNRENSSIPIDRLGPEAVQRYGEIMTHIENASSGLSLSPIDVMKNELKKAGYKVGELTGRKAEFVYNEDGSVKRVNRTDTDKKKIAAQFNNGEIDALILNRSAGTGISLHASSKFKDQRPRIMIVAQAQGDVNDEVQIRGRIDRTGQVSRGQYEYVVSNIPSEQRLLMMLKSKLRSLDANTTSSQKSKFNEMQVQDVMNKYGDDVLIQYLSEHPETYAKLADPLKLGDEYDTLSPEDFVKKATKADGDGATASKILGRMALLTVKEQEAMLDDITELYKAEIDRLNDMGENDLEITEMPLQAKTLDKKIWEEGAEPDSGNPFADNTYVETVEMNVLRKPMKASEVKATQERMLGGKTYEEYKAEQIAKLDRWQEERIANLRKEFAERATRTAEKEREKYLKSALKHREKSGMTEEECEKMADAQYKIKYDAIMEKLDTQIGNVKVQYGVFQRMLDQFSTDRVYVLPSNIYDLSQIDFSTRFGKVIGIKIANNYSTAASTVTFATLDGRRKITVPVSGMVKDAKGEKANLFQWIDVHTKHTRQGIVGQNAADQLRVLEMAGENWDKMRSSATRKKGAIITGNLLQALVSTKNQNLNGKLISYTTDTGEIRQGLLMPDTFDPKTLTGTKPISDAYPLLENGTDVKSADGSVIITKGYGSYYEIRVPKSVKEGGRFFQDNQLLRLVDDNSFYTSGGRMVAEFHEDNLKQILEVLSTKMKVGVQTDSDGKIVPWSDNNVRHRAGYTNEQKARFDEKENARLVSKIKTFCDKTNISDRVIVHDSAEGLPEYAQTDRGWFDPKTGQIHIMINNHETRGDVMRTLFHESVAHYGLRKMFGSNFDTFLDDVYRGATDDIRKNIDGIMKKDGLDLRTATEEYMAKLSEGIDYEHPEVQSWFTKVKDAFVKMLHKLGVWEDVPTITDDELKYILWRSYENMKEPGRFRSLRGTADDIAKRNELGIATEQDKAVARSMESDQTILHRKMDAKNEEDKKRIDDFEKSEKVKVYRSMQVIDGKLYPPMNAAFGGTLVEGLKPGDYDMAEEHPELAYPKQMKDGSTQYYFDLDKGSRDATGKKATAVKGVLYDPYIHSKNNMLNDQFKSAWIRPNVVTVELEISKNELESGYRAEKAGLSVGEHSWKPGTVAKELMKLGRHDGKLYLTQMAKIVRVVPDAEVAQNIAKMVEGTGVEIPENCVQPKLRAELERLGVKIGAPEKGVKKTEQIEEALNLGLQVENTLRLRDGEDRLRLSRGQKRALETAVPSENSPFKATVVSSADGAKVVKNLETLAKNTENLSSSQKKSFLSDVAKALGAEQKGSNSQYATFETKNGRIVTVRLADHNATTSTFDKHDEDYGISIVISRKPNEGINNDGDAHIVEFFYADKKLNKAEGKPLADIVRAIQQALYSGEYKDPTGLAERQEVNAEQIRLFTSQSEAMERTPQHVEKMRSFAQSLVDGLGGNGQVVTSPSQLDEAGRAALKRNSNMKGYYDTKTGKVVIYAPNAESEYDVQRTVQHEKIGHEGLRKALGEANYRRLFNSLWKNFDANERAEIRKRATANGWNFSVAMDEYLAERAETFSSEDRGFWQKVKDVWNDVMRGIGFKQSTTEADIRTALWLSKNALEGKFNTVEYRIRKAAFERNLRRNSPKEEMPEDALSYGTKKEDTVADPMASDPALDLVLRGGNMSDKQREEIMAGLTMAGRLAQKQYNERLKSLSYVWNEAYYDRLAGARVMQEIITGMKGDDVPAKYNIVNNLEALGSRSQQSQEKFMREQVKPLMDEVVKATVNLEGKTPQERYKAFELYATIKSGLERNRVLYVRDLVKALKDSKDPDPAKREQDVKDAELIQESFGQVFAEQHDLLSRGEINLREFFAKLDDTIADFVRDREIGYEPGKKDYSGISDEDYKALTDAGIALGKGEYDDAAAIDYVMNAESRIGADGVRKAWKHIKGISDGMVDTAYEAGLINETAKNRMQTMFKWYLPLRGFDAMTAEEVYGYINSRNGGTGVVNMRASGRHSMSETPISTLLAMADSNLLRANRNVAKQAVARLANDFNNNLLTPYETWYEETTDGAGNVVLKAYDPMIPENATAEDIESILKAHEEDVERRKEEGEKFVHLKDYKTNTPYRIVKDQDRDQHIVSVMLNGVRKDFIVHGNPRAAQAINGLVKDTSAKWLKTTNSWFSKMMTSYSLTFMARNTFRDYTFASASGAAYEYGRSKQWNRDFQKMYFTDTNTLSLFTKYRNGTLDESNQTHRWFKEFVDNGGMTGYTQLNKRQDYENKIRKALSDEFEGLEGATKSSNKFVRVGALGVKGLQNILTAGLDAVERMNEAAENKARFAAYCASRMEHRNIARSVHDAKEISVNFNRAGAGKATHTLMTDGADLAWKVNRDVAAYTAHYFRNAMWFFNPAVQGMARTFKMATGGDAKQTARFIASFMAVPAALHFASYAISSAFAAGDDDDEKKKYGDDPFDQLPDYVRRDNMCIYLGHGRFVTVPLAIELRAFYGLADVFRRMTEGKRSEKGVLSEVFEQFTQMTPFDLGGGSKVAFNSGLGSAIGAVTPSVIQPLIATVTNVGWTGGPVSNRRSYNESQAEWKRSLSTVNDTYLSTSKWLSTTGSNAIADAAEKVGVSPETTRSWRGDEAGAQGGLIDLNPSVAQYLLESYSGGPGKEVGEFINFGNNIYKQLENGNADIDFTRLPILKAFSRSARPANAFAVDRNRWYAYSSKYMKETKPRLDSFRKNGEALWWNTLMNSKEGKIGMVVRYYSPAIKKLTTLKNSTSNIQQKNYYAHRINLLMHEAITKIDDVEKSE